MLCGINSKPLGHLGLSAPGPDGTTTGTTEAGNQRPERQGRWEGRAREGSKGLTQESGDTTSEESAGSTEMRSLLRIEGNPKTLIEHSRSGRKWLDGGSREPQALLSNYFCTKNIQVQIKLFPRRAHST